MDHPRAHILRRSLAIAAASVVLCAPLIQAWAEPSTTAVIDLDEALSQGSRPLEASAAVELALERSPSLERARAQVALARVGARQARMAFVPRVEMSGRYMRIGGFEDGSISLGGGGSVPTEQALALASAVEDPAAQLLLSSMIEQQSALPSEVAFETPRNQTGFRASLVVPLSDMLLTIRPAYRAAQGQVRLEEERAAIEAAEVALSAEEAYYRYAQARGALAVTEGALALAEDHAEQMNAHVEAGFGARANQLAAAARVAAVRGHLARAQGGVALTRTALLTLIGLEDDGEEIALTESLTSPVPPVPQVTEALVEGALERRPEMGVLRELTGVHQQMERAARGGHSPRIALVAGADVANPNQRVIPPTDEFVPSWEVGVVVSWSPNDSMNAAARAQSARARQRMVEADILRLRDGLRLRLERARVDQVAAQAVFEAATERTEASGAALEARQAELRAGQAVATQRLDAELELTRARLEGLNAAVNLRIANARFRRALGE